MKIAGLKSWQILDSRGRPTVAVEAALDNGVRAVAQVPSGASTGRHEAVELRDGDPRHYGGKGVLQAVSNVEGPLAAAVAGMDAEDQAALDRRMIELDGTPNKGRLGANATLGVSCAVARAAAQAKGIPLWKHLAAHRSPRMPVPMVNIFSGGLHAGGNIEFQDFLVIPHGFDGISAQMEAVVAIHGAARRILDSHGYAMTGVADEGGWGPRLESNERALALLNDAIRETGAEGAASIAIDVASSHFYRDGVYTLKTEKLRLDAAGMVSLLEQWCDRYPVISIEDGLEEDDWSGWQALTQRLGERAQLVGDDFFTTSPERVRRGIRDKAGNAVLVKMNQIGTLTETFEVVDLAREAGWKAVISARSGETEDSFLADLAVATGAGQIKVGSITRSERLAKYNRLLEIERNESD
ncbi:MAG: phosphopyruvate hydratase [Bryobacteraceae bacterium]